MSADTRAMEFKFDDNVVAVDEVLKINNTLTAEGYDKNVGSVFITYIYIRIKYNLYIIHCSRALSTSFY